MAAGPVASDSTRPAPPPPRQHLPGLWHVQLRDRDTPVKYMPLHEAPFHKARGSCGLPFAGEKPAGRLDRCPPGTAEPVAFQLRNVAGNPVRGFVRLDPLMDTAAFTGSTDASGTVLFSGVQPGKHTLEALLHAISFPTWARRAIRCHAMRTGRTGRICRTAVHSDVWGQQ